MLCSGVPSTSHFSMPFHYYVCRLSTLCQYMHLVLPQYMLLTLTDTRFLLFAGMYSLHFSGIYLLPLPLPLSFPSLRLWIAFSTPLTLPFGYASFFSSLCHSLSSSIFASRSLFISFACPCPCASDPFPRRPLLCLLPVPLTLSLCFALCPSSPFALPRPLPFLALALPLPSQSTLCPLFDSPSHKDYRLSTEV